MNKTTNERIIEYSNELKLPVFRRDFIALAKETAAEHMDYENFLLQLLQRNMNYGLKIVENHR